MTASVNSLASVEEMVLPAAAEIALDHHPDDRAVAGKDLADNLGQYVRLALGLPAGVVVIAIDHDGPGQTRLLQQGFDRRQMRGRQFAVTILQPVQMLEQSGGSTSTVQACCSSQTTAS